MCLNMTGDQLPDPRASLGRSRRASLKRHNSADVDLLAAAAAAAQAVPREDVSVAGGSPTRVIGRSMSLEEAGHASLFGFDDPATEDPFNPRGSFVVKKSSRSLLKPPSNDTPQASFRVAKKV